MSIMESLCILHALDDEHPRQDGVRDPELVRPLPEEFQVLGVHSYAESGHELTLLRSPPLSGP